MTITPFHPEHAPRWSRQDPAGVSPEFRMFDVEEELGQVVSELKDARWEWVGDMEGTGSEEPLRRGDKELTELEESIKNLKVKVATAIKALTKGKD